MGKPCVLITISKTARGYDHGMATSVWKPHALTHLLRLLRLSWPNMNINEIQEGFVSVKQLSLLLSYADGPFFSPPILIMLPSKLRQWTSLAILAIGLAPMRPLWASAQQSTVVCLSDFAWVGLLSSPRYLSAVLTNMSRI